MANFFRLLMAAFLVVGALVVGAGSATTINHASPLANNLVFAWIPSAGDSGSTAVDLSGSGNDGTISGATWNGDGSLTFDSDSDSITFGKDVGTISGGTFTVFAKINPVGSTTVAGSVISGSSWGYPTLTVDAVASSPSTVTLRPSGYAYVAESSRSYEWGSDQTIGITYDGTDYNFFKDGTSISSGSNAKTFSSGNTIIGKSGVESNKNFLGKIYYYFIWNRELSSSEISSLTGDNFGGLTATAAPINSRFRSRSR